MNVNVKNEVCNVLIKKKLQHLDFRLYYTLGSGHYVEQQVHFGCHLYLPHLDLP